MLITLKIGKTSEREPGHWRIVEGETNDSFFKGLLSDGTNVRRMRVCKGVTADDRCREQCKCFQQYLGSS